MRVAVVGSRGIGGVRTFSSMLLSGLGREGIELSEVRQGNHFYNAFLNDARFIERLGRFDAVIYRGLYVRLSDLIPCSLVRGVIVNGFVEEEILGSVISSNPIRVIASVANLTNLHLQRKLSRVDFLVTHSLTTYERIAIPQRRVSLPQFVFEEDLDRLDSSHHERHGDAVRILAYTSLVKSPRLLTREQLEIIAELLHKHLGGRLQFLVVGARLRRPQATRCTYLEFMERPTFLRLLASSDLYLECCTDEEIRLGTIEAGSMGVPVAKLTRHDYVGRQDYGPDEIIVDESIEGLVARVLYYVNHIGSERAVHGESLRNFLRTKRNWNSVKGPLLRALSR
jgi:hypothetical protein